MSVELSDIIGVINSTVISAFFGAAIVMCIVVLGLPLVYDYQFDNRAIRGRRTICPKLHARTGLLAVTLRFVQGASAFDLSEP